MICWENNIENEEKKLEGLKKEEEKDENNIMGNKEYEENKVEKPKKNNSENYLCGYEINDRSICLHSLHYSCKEEQKKKENKMNKNDNFGLDSDDKLKEEDLDTIISSSPSSSSSLSKKMLRKMKGKEIRMKEREDIKAAKFNDVDCSFSINSPFPEWITPDFETLKDEIQMKIKKIIDIRKK
jgi:hypothetical protein